MKALVIFLAICSTVCADSYYPRSPQWNVYFTVPLDNATYIPTPRYRLYSPPPPVWYYTPLHYQMQGGYVNGYFIPGW
jgi:hypothetical protein